jgi:hypothetical protein
MQQLVDNFGKTLSGLEEGLRIEHIATTEMKTCGIDDDPVRVLTDAKLMDFDQIPVKEFERIVGVLERKPIGNGVRMRDAMQTLDGAMFVTDKQPVGSFLEKLRHQRYFLMVSGSEIKGLVTTSDLLKLPVRVYAFMLVTHLEMVMAAAIRIAFRGQPEDACLLVLSTSRRGRVEEKIARFASQRLNPSIVEFTDFCDKRTIVKKSFRLDASFETELKAIEEVRNSVAHAGMYAEDGAALLSFIDRLEQARFWADKVSKLRTTDLRPKPANPMIANRAVGALSVSS